MQALALQSRRGDGHLWLIAFALSLLANFVLLAVIGLAALESTEFRKKQMSAAPPPPPETVAKIFPIPAAGEPENMPAPEPEQRFARTSPDQAAPPPDNTAFIGERDTRATSDRSPLADAPPLPSQAGIEPRDALDIETTESDYQDGTLSPQAPAPPETKPEISATADTPPPLPPPDKTPAPQPAAALPPPSEALLDGPNPVDINVSRETSISDKIKPATEKRPDAESQPPEPQSEPQSEPQPVAETPKPKPPKDPAFSGFQRKTAVMGSISRTGRSALDVADTALGRYQAAISRAVELEWQRNCVRHRDLITPGFLTVRFFVETSGKVRSVQFVGDMETGEVQKGFTLNSIRDAEIPSMPKALRGEYDNEPLELIFRFYF